MDVADRDGEESQCGSNVDQILHGILLEPSRGVGPLPICRDINRAARATDVDEHNPVTLALEPLAQLLLRRTPVLHSIRR